MSYNYDKFMEEAEKKRTTAIICMRLCFESLEFRPILDKIAKMQFEKVLSTKDSSIQKEMDKLMYFLSICMDDSKRNKEIDYISAREKIKDQLRLNGVNFSSSDVSRLLIPMQNNNPFKALQIYMNQYKEAVSNYEYYQRKKIEELTAKQENRTNSQSTRTDTKQDYFSSMPEEELKKNVIAGIEKYVNNQENYGGISEQLERQIVQLYPSLKEGNKYFSLDVLKQGIKLSSLASKKNYYYSEIATAAVITFNTTVKDLLQGADYTNKASDIFMRVGVSDSLKKYEQIYNKYMKYYNSLTQQEKAAVNDAIKRTLDYQKLFGDEIVSPEEMKNHINRHVSQYIIKNKDSFIQNIQLLSHAVSYMSPEEVKMVYKGIISEDNRKPFNLRMKQEKLEDAQEIFGKVALDKIDRASAQKLNVHHSNEVTEQDRKIAAVIVGLFKEKPINKKFERIAQAEDLTNLYESLFEEYNSKKSATPSIFGIERVMDAFKKLQKWVFSLLKVDTSQDTNQDTNQDGFTKKY